MTSSARSLLRAIVLAGAALLSAPNAPAADSAAAPAGFARRWVYISCNFQVDAKVDEILAVLRRAAAAGYNGAVITDSKFGRLQERPANYYANLDRLRRTADELKLELIPCVMPVGYSNSILQNDPNLAEGLPVRGAELRVRDGKATPAEPRNQLPFGDMEQSRDNKILGWDWIDGPGKTSFSDRTVHHAGMQSVRLENFTAGNEAGNARMNKKLMLKPWRQYHLSVWIRARTLEPAGGLRAVLLTPDGRELNFTNLGVKPNQDWREHHVVFNSLGYSEVNLYIGLWGGIAGTFWVDDVRLQECAGVNLLRREGCPVTVTSQDGGTTYVEGRDYERWTDPRLGRIPWPGEYEPWHLPPPLTAKPGGRILDGEVLRVSYFHAQTIYDGAVPCCLRDPAVFRLFNEQVAQLQTRLRPKSWFLAHDELRLAGWCDLCTREDWTAGQLLAENVRQCTEILRRRAPQAELLVWSDMFDPNHNAVKQYYLVRNSLAGSWEGLDPALSIVNWNSGKAADSLRFFADRGHRQIIAGYYDSRDVAKTTAAWKKAADGVPRVDGILYTTWKDDYRDLEAFAKEAWGARP